jgi:hypothetical protein
METKEWEKEFDEKFAPEDLRGLDESINFGDPVAMALNGQIRSHLKHKEEKRKEIKYFISHNFIPISLLHRNIGMLRQWLNEDRITDPKKMVTNEDIKHWLDLQTFINNYKQ